MPHRARHLRGCSAYAVPSIGYQTAGKGYGEPAHCLQQESGPSRHRGPAWFIWRSLRRWLPPVYANFCSSIRPHQLPQDSLHQHTPITAVCTRAAQHACNTCWSARCAGLLTRAGMVTSPAAACCCCCCRCCYWQDCAAAGCGHHSSCCVVQLGALLKHLPPMHL